MVKRVKRVKRGLAERQLFITTKDFDESLSAAKSENLMASGLNSVVVRKEFLFQNPELSRKTERVAVDFTSEGLATYDLLRRHGDHWNVDRYLISGVSGGFGIVPVPKPKTPDHRCASPPERFSGMTFWDDVTPNENIQAGWATEGIPTFPNHPHRGHACARRVWSF